MSSLLREVVKNQDAKGQRGRGKPVNRVHDNNASVLAISGCEVLDHGKFDAAVMVVRKVVDAWVAHPVVQDLLDCDEYDIGNFDKVAKEVYKNNANDDTAPACSRLYI